MTNHTPKDTGDIQTETTVSQKRTYGRRSSDGIHIERSIPLTYVLALALAILTQIAVGIWFEAGQVSKTDDHERRIVKLELNVDELSKRITDALSDLKQSTARTEGKIDGLSLMLNSVKQK